MQIYAIANPAQLTTNYVCDSQDTITAGQNTGYTGVFSIGTETDANTILATNQQLWLTQQADIFCVNKNIVNSDGHIEWVTVDLSTEPANTDVVYRLLNTPNGDWIEETGLIPAQTKFASIQQNYLAFSNLSLVAAWTEWKPLPKPLIK
jgi:hypothetical protein